MDGDSPARGSSHHPHVIRPLIPPRRADPLVLRLEPSLVSVAPPAPLRAVARRPRPSKRLWGQLILLRRCVAQHIRSIPLSLSARARLLNLLFVLLESSDSSNSSESPESAKASSPRSAEAGRSRRKRRSKKTRTPRNYFILPADPPLSSRFRLPLLSMGLRSPRRRTTATALSTPRSTSSLT